MIGIKRTLKEKKQYKHYHFFLVYCEEKGTILSPNLRTVLENDSIRQFLNDEGM